MTSNVNLIEKEPVEEDSEMLDQKAEEVNTGGNDEKVDCKQDSKMDEDSDDETLDKDPPPTAEIVEEVNNILATSQSVNYSNLTQSIDKLLYMEKKQRQAEMEANTIHIAKSLLQLCFDSGDWNITVEQIAVLSRRRSQFRRVVMRIVQYSMAWIDSIVDTSKKLKLINTLINVTQGKIFVEVERARLTRKLSKMKEDEGDIAEACDILQELQIETFGTMRKKEKCDFLLEQIRLNLAKKDFIRAAIVRNKIKSRVIQSLPELEIKYWKYSLILFYHHNQNYLELCKSYQRLKELMITNDDKVINLSNAVFAIVLAEYSNEQKDILHRILKNEEKILEQLPIFNRLLTMLTTDELINYPLTDDMNQRLSVFQFTGVVDDNQEFGKLFHDRIVQHNIRVIALYYSRISSVRLSQFLNVSEDETERYMSEMVTDGHIYARIDRMDGVIQFRKKETANSMLNDWRSDVSKLLDLVDLTCHQIHKEMMVHSDKNKIR